LLQVQVHFAAYVGENAIFEHSIQQSLRAVHGVARTHPDQSEQAGTDGSDHRSLDAHARLQHPLQQRDHGLGGPIRSDDPRDEPPENPTRRSFRMKWVKWAKSAFIFATMWE
jgi:hypothetical protein